MKNFVQLGDRIAFAAANVVTINNVATAYSASNAASGPKSGEAGLIGRVVGVVVADSVNGSAGVVNDGNVVLETRGVFQFSVTCTHHAMSVGSTCYIGTGTGVLNDDYTQVPFGVILDAVGSGATTSVRVKLFGATPGAIGADS
jgi:predicted RecA/RadA family phage recombinase